MLKAWRKWRNLFSNSGFLAFLRFYINGKLKRGEKTEDGSINRELKQAAKELIYKERQFMLATAEFEPAAWQELRKAHTRVNTLIEKKRGENR